MQRLILDILQHANTNKREIPSAGRKDGYMIHRSLGAAFCCGLLQRVLLSAFTESNERWRGAVVPSSRSTSRWIPATWKTDIDRTEQQAKAGASMPSRQVSIRCLQSDVKPFPEGHAK